MKPADRLQMELAFRRHAEMCARLGGPLYAAMMSIAADDIARRGVTWQIVSEFEADPMQTTLPFRVMRDLHHEALAGSAPRLARHFPTCGGEPDHEHLREDFLTTMRALQGVVRFGMDRAVQTNEVGRSTGLVGAYALIGQRFPEMPVRILEIGASAGLNLHWPAFGYRFERRDAASVALNPQAPVRLTAAWSGPMPDLCRVPQVHSRAACDLEPADLESEAGRRWLRAQVWPEHPDRMATIEAAIEMARESHLEVERAAAQDWLPRQLERVAEGVATVVQHTVMWHLVPEEARRAIDAAFDEAAASASEKTPLMRVSIEWETDLSSYPVRLRDWTGADHLLGHIDGHGRRVAWTASTWPGAGTASPNAHAM